MIEGRPLLAKFVSVAAVALIGVATAGCDVPETPMGVDGQPAQTSTESPQAAATTCSNPAEAGDYSRLLLQPGDLSDGRDTFSARSTDPAPDGLPGASVLFVNADDTRAISNTLVVYPHAETAARTLRDGLPQSGTVVAGGAPRPVPVGNDGTLVAGTAPDGTKTRTLLMFTEGPALAQLQFETALGDVTDEDYAISAGKMQQIALRTGLADCG